MLKIYTAYLILLSIITFIVYGVDKRKAIKHAWRIKESVLLLLGFLSGYGGFLGMIIFRHKTAREHWYFAFVNVLAGIVHSAVLVYMIFFL